MDIQNKFKKRFVTLLEADMKNEISDEQAMAETLDKNSTPADFDAETPDQLQSSEDQALQASQDLMNVVGTQNQIMFEKIKEWIDKIQGFVDFLNGTSDNSIQSNLTKAIPETIFDKIKTAESKKIARAAVDLATLAEIFKGYLSQTQNSRLRGI